MRTTEIHTYTHLIDSLLILPLGLMPLFMFDLSDVPLPIWGLVFWYALLTSIFSFWLWMKDIRHVPTHLTGVFTSVLPIAAATYGIVALGETSDWPHDIALVCAAAGILIAGWLTRPRRPTHRSCVMDPLDPLDPSLDHE